MERQKYQNPPIEGASACVTGTWEMKNERRLALIDKKFRTGLNPDEETELVRLKTEVFEHLQQVDPREAEDPAEIDARYERIKQRMIAKREMKV